MGHARSGHDTISQTANIVGSVRPDVHTMADDVAHGFLVKLEINFLYVLSSF